MSVLRLVTMVGLEASWKRERRERTGGLEGLQHRSLRSCAIAMAVREETFPFYKILIAQLNAK
jgi:hypothetical protein